MAIELHQRECPAPEAHESLDVAIRQMRLMESYLQRFLAIGRPRENRRDRVQADALVADVVAMVQPACRHAGIELRAAEPPQSLSLCGDAEELRQLIMNLVLNAVDAVSDHGPAPACVEIDLQQCGESRARLTITDTGPGPREDVAERLFQPFVTGKPDGTGLGLFVARQIAEDHAGTIGWERRDGRTVFVVELPVWKSEG